MAFTTCLILTTALTSPWTGPVVFSAIVGTGALVLSIVNSVLHWADRRIRYTVRAERTFDPDRPADVQLAEFQVAVTNTGPNPFTVCGTTFVGARAGDRHVTIDPSGVRLEAGQRWVIPRPEPADVEDARALGEWLREWFDWTEHTHVVIDVEPGRRQRIRLPHRKPAYERRAKAIIRKVGRRAGPYRLWAKPNETGYFFGTDRASWAYLDPLALTYLGDPAISKSTAAGPILEHLASEHPDLFEFATDPSGEKQLRWLPAVFKRFQD